MKDYNSDGLSGPITLGECVQAVTEVDNTANQYYINLVKDELEDLLEKYDNLYKEIKTNRREEVFLINGEKHIRPRVLKKKVIELLKEKIEIINGAM
jgi:hypothetical protein